MRNKSISKQSGGHKQSGGGGTFSSMFSSPSPPPEPIDILLITSHGDYMESELKLFKSPIENIQKISVAPIGECSYLNEKQADIIKDKILQILYKKTNMDTISTGIMDMLKLINKTKYRIGIDDKKKIIKHIKKGNEEIDKVYVVEPRQRKETSSPYFDSITLLSRPPHNDLIQEIKGRTYHQEEQFIPLSEILYYIQSKYPDITNLIIVDLSCATFNYTRHNRLLLRNFTPGGYYKKIHKKFKKTNNKKLARKALAKKNKTRKIQQS